ncbi:UNKNOWN [Stylonychia lemnae]|uniref:Uncharacterized protein n=1 Tax=Stylonychia lemnae TaxID=5949 RepID=A0A078AZK5_STYLE|nr:UNKNOWN [Stylonychia lemnae]|eukprot:CDW87531.1 UNKNOWN [Stylonychia lemnae]
MLKYIGITLGLVLGLVNSKGAFMSEYDRVSLVSKLRDEQIHLQNKILHLEQDLRALENIETIFFNDGSRLFITDDHPHQIVLNTYPKVSDIIENIKIENHGNADNFDINGFCH